MRRPPADLAWYMAASASARRASAVAPVPSVSAMPTLALISRQPSVASFPGDHRGDLALLEPGEEPPELGAQRRAVLERPEQRLDGVDDHALGADLVNRRAQPDEQPVEIPLAGLLHIGVQHADVVDDQTARRFELGEVKAQRGDVSNEVLHRLLEGDEDARFIELGDATNQELHREQRLATSSRTTHRGGLRVR
jgi:hypothetical protein